MLYFRGYTSKRLALFFQLCSTVFNTFQQSWKMLMHSVCLSVCPFVCVSSNCRICSSDIFKFIHALHIWCRMDSIENDGTKCSFTETHKSFPIHFGLSVWDEFFKVYCNMFIADTYYLIYNIYNAEKVLLRCHLLPQVIGIKSICFRIKHQIQFQLYQMNQPNRSWKSIYHHPCCLGFSLNFFSF